MQEFDEKGLLYYTKNGLPRLKYYLDEMPGIPLQDMWYDIGKISSQSSERVDYPTQKPEALLERIIKASSNPGDIVFDCFMGSGTTQSVAMKLGRRYIGADINLGAIQTTTKRLIQVAKELKPRQVKLQLEKESDEAKITTCYTGFEVYNVNHYDVFRNPVQAREVLLETLEIQPLPGNKIFSGEKDGRMVYIMPVNRIATRKDLNNLLTNLDLKQYRQRQLESPVKPVELITLVCMGHEPDLKAEFEKGMQDQGFKVDVEVVDILRHRQDLQFKRDSEAHIVCKNGELSIERFYPMNLLQKLSLMREQVGDDWRELVESVFIDWNYDGAVLHPALLDSPSKNELVKGRYNIPDDAGTIRVKITDLLSESLELNVEVDGQE